MNGNPVSGILSEIQRSLQSTLARIRQTYDHAATKGSVAEIAFRDFLRQLMPADRSVGHGEIVDRRGKRSSQMDVVVTHAHHPRMFFRDEPSLFLIEGVAAAAEVKSQLTLEGVRAAIDAARRMRELQFKAGAGTLITANNSDANRFYESPPFMLFAYESRAELESIAQVMADSVSGMSLDGPRLLDAVYVLDVGWVIDLGDGHGSFQLRSAPSGEPMSGVRYDQTDDVLVALTAWFSLVIPRLVNPPPVLPGYLVAGGSR